MLLKPCNDTSDADVAIKRLRSELVWIAVYGFAGLLICASALILTTSLAPASIWLLASCAFYILVCQQTGKRLQLNRSEIFSPLYPDLGWANRMTIARGWLIAATGGCLFIPSLLQQQVMLIWGAAAAYSVAAIFDRLDGFVARKTQRSSLLGAELDTVFDALGLLVAPLLALQLGKIHASYLLVSVAYYFFILGIQVRRRQNKPVHPLTDSKLRRTLAGFQMAYVAVALWPPFKSEVTVLAGFGFMFPVLFGFLVDWLVVSGRINPYKSKTTTWLRKMYSVTENIFLPSLRLIVLIALTYSISYSHWSSTALLIAGTSVLMMLSGFAGRAGAMMLMMVLAWTVPMSVNEPAMFVMLFSAITIVLFGCGRFSIWQGDDDWVNRQDGA